MTLKKPTNNYVIFDSHAHIYPDKIAKKASQSVSDFYGIKMNFIGSCSELLEEGKKAGVSKFLVHSVATTKEQVRKINEFLIGQVELHSEFIGFMTLHPNQSLSELVEEVNFGLANGLKGVKLHPDFQKFFVDSDESCNIFKAVNGKCPILFHAGDKRYHFSSPKRLAKMAKAFPNQIMICAHFGGYSQWDEIECYNGLENVYFDTCSSLEFLNKEEAEKIINHFGAEKFLFGTDYPMWSAKDEIEKLLKLNLTEGQFKQIFSENLIKLLNL